MQKLDIFKLIMIFTIFFVFCTCNSQNSTSSRLKVKNEKYSNSLNRFDKNLTKHFPDKIEEKTNLYERFSPKVGEVGIHLMTSFETTPKIEDTILARYKPNEDCLFVINRFANNQNYGYNISISTTDSIQIEKDCFLNRYPVPNFWSNSYSTDSTICKLPNDFVLNVLEAKSGKFLEDSLLTDGKFMPKKWKNGFSRGIAISEKRKIAIYWLVFW